MRWKLNKKKKEKTNLEKKGAKSNNITTKKQKKKKKLLVHFFFILQSRVVVWVNKQYKCRGHSIITKKYSVKALTLKGIKQKQFYL